MFEILIITMWVLGVALVVLWVFLPWIIILKLDQIIGELRRISTGAGNK